MNHIAVYRAAAQIDASAAEKLRKKLELIAGPADSFERFEEKYKFVPESDAGNLNYAVQTVEFTLLHDLGEAESRVRYLGSKLQGGLTAVEVTASPRFREFLKMSGFKIEADHLAVGWRLETRLGVTVEVYRATNAVIDQQALVAEDRLSWLRGNDVLPGQLICELGFKCETGDIAKKKATLETLFNETVKPFVNSQLCLVEV